jgi:hypothetical protein
MKNFYLTFGQAHPLKDGWVLVRAESYDVARTEVFEIFGAKFATLYKEEDFKSSYFPAGQIGYVIYVS